MKTRKKAKKLPPLDIPPKVIEQIMMGKPYHLVMEYRIGAKDKEGKIVSAEVKIAKKP